MMRLSAAACLCLSLLTFSYGSDGEQSPLTTNTANVIFETGPELHILDESDYRLPMKRGYVAQFDWTVPPLSLELMTPLDYSRVETLHNDIRDFKSGEELRGRWLPRVDALPDDQRPKQAIVDQLFSAALVVANTQTTLGSTKLSLKLYAENADQAQHLVDAFRDIYTHVLSGPVEQSLLAGKDRAATEFSKANSDLQSALARVSEYSKELESLSEYRSLNADSISELATQERIMSIDIAGVKAKISACNKILQRSKDLRATLIEHVESEKIAAEIELVGLSARQSAVAPIIDKGESRLELIDHQSKAQKDVDRLSRVLCPQLKSRLERYTEATAAWHRNPVQGSKVTLSPFTATPQ